VSWSGDVLDDADAEAIADVVQDEMRRSSATG
jgi:hypothetical protein